MKAIVLSAGLGTRLYPLTKDVPKPALKLVGKSILERALESIIEAGVNLEDIVLVLGPENSFQTLLGEIDKRFAHDFAHVIQEERKGTADALKTGLKLVSNEDVIVLNGDVIFEKKVVIGFVKNLNESPDLGLLAVTEVDNWQQFGLVLGNDEGYITGLKEKTNVRDEHAVGINAGLYYFPKNYLDELDNVVPSERGEYEITDLISNNIRKGNLFRYFKFDGLWTDVGRPYDLLNVHEKLMELEKENFEIRGKVESGVQINGKIYLAPTARLRSGVYIDGTVYIDEGADIGPNCYIRGKTYLGRNTRIGNACEIKNSIIYDHTHIAHLSYVGDSIIGQHCNFGAGTITANLRHDNKNVKITIKGKRVDSGRRKLGVIMGDNVKTGIGVSILPGVVIGSNSWIAAGITINRDVPENTLLIEEKGEKKYLPKK